MIGKRKMMTMRKRKVKDESTAYVDEVQTLGIRGRFDSNCCTHLNCNRATNWDSWSTSVLYRIKSPGINMYILASYTSRQVPLLQRKAHSKTCRKDIAKRESYKISKKQKEERSGINKKEVVKSQEKRDVNLSQPIHQPRQRQPIRQLPPTLPLNHLRTT